MTHDCHFPYISHSSYLSNNKTQHKKDPKDIHLSLKNQLYNTIITISCSCVSMSGSIP